MAQVTKAGSPDFVPPAERIAVFDNDGTLWAEQPMYFQVLFALDRVKALAPQHPEWKDEEPFASLLKGDVKGAMADGMKSVVEIIMATHAGMTTAEFETIVSDWIATARHPTTKRPYTEMVYQPMLEVLAYLRANGFKTFIVSGGGIEFMRPWSEKVYGVPPEQVIGSSIKVKFEMRDGEPVLVRLPELDFFDDKEGKPVAIHQQIGRRPHCGVRQLRRRPADAAMDDCRAGAAVRALRPPHGRRARMGLRSRVQLWPPRQGPRRSTGERLDGCRHEAGLEGHLPA